MLTLCMKKSQSTTEIEQLVELNKKMGVVIALLLRSVSRDILALPLKEQIAILDGLGVRPVEMASIVGKKPGHISKELVSIRRSVKK